LLICGASHLTLDIAHFVRKISSGRNYNPINMAHIARRDLVLFLVGTNTDGRFSGEIGGITRLQKLLYLLEKEGHITPTKDGFEFTPYKAGPYSSKLYDDLEFLENLGLIESEVVAEATEPEKAEADLLSFEELMGDGSESPQNPTNVIAGEDAYEEHRFRLSPQGLKRIQELVEKGDYQPVVDGIRKIKSRYGNHSLMDLLRYVYTKYPEMTTESEIKDKVLKKG
jgi:hypothetical protein